MIKETFKMIKEIFKFLSQSFRTTRRLTGAEWSKKNVYLTTGGTRGRFSFASNPFMEVVQNATTQAGVDQVTVMGSPQTTGKTTFLANTSMERGHQRPLPQLYVSSNQTKASEWCQTELRPRMEACEALRDQLPTPNRKRYDWARKMFKLGRYWIRIAGGQTDADIKSISVALLMMDEVDAWIKYGGNRSKGKAKSAREAPFVTLAKERVASFKASGEAMILVASTPSTLDGPVYLEYLSGTQETARPRCPHCKKLWKHRVTIADYDLTSGERPIPKNRKDQVRGPGDWDLDKLRNGAVWKCPSCNGKIGNSDRGLSLINGSFVAESPQTKPRHRSFHLSRHVGRAMSSTPIGDAAVAYVESLYMEGGGHHYANTWEAWPFEPASIKRDSGEIDRVIELSPGYNLTGNNSGKKRILPDGLKPVVIFGSIDVQAYSLVYVVRAIDTLGRRWLLDADIVEGCEVIQLTERLKEIEWVESDNHENGFFIYEVWCDAGYKAMVSGSVYEAHRAFPDFLFPVAGRSRTNHRLVSDVSSVAQLDQATNTEIPVFWIDDDLFKRRLYGQMISRAGAENWVGWFLSSDIDDVCPKYRQQLLSEREAKKQDGKLEWTKRGPNDFGDAEKYILAMIHHHKENIAEWTADLLEEEEEKQSRKLKTR